MAALTACSLIDKKALKSDIYVHLSVGEERNALGAKTLPYVLEADGCIVLDVNFAHTRDIKEYESLEMGKGAGVSYSATIKRELTDFVTSTAKKHNIPFQSVVEMRSTGTNATFMHKNAIACAVLSIPLKNMHTSCECVNLTDIEDCAELLARLCENFHNCKNVGKIIIK